MDAPESEKAGVDGAGPYHKTIDRHGNAIDPCPTPPDHSRKRTACRDVHDRIASLDPIFGEGVASSWDASEAFGDEVYFGPSGAFSFQDEVRDPTDAVFAVLILCRDETSEIADIAAWRPDTGELSLWLGRVSMLGQEQVFAARLDEPLRVFRTLPDWLRADRDGIVIVDERRARHLLDGTTLSVGEDEIAFGQTLRDRLTIAPQIVVARGPA
jgi:hypothetical protein